MLAPLSIQVQHVYKSFASNNGTWSPFKRFRDQGKRLSVLEDITFDVHRGEVFGVVGTNGAGKSTLLKLIAGIYRIDRGTIRVGGRVAPLIELGVGFRPDLPARPNILLNGVMMGLSPDEAKRRTDEIIDFAELRGFEDLQLKNYSSGMRGRLGFSIMTHVDSDVLLVDEIMAVGDKAFRDKCGDVIAGMRSRGSTVVLVSHEMGSIIKNCDRAMLVHGHHVECVGQPEEVADRYLAVNSRRRWKAAAQDEAAADAAEVLEFGFAGSEGEDERKMPTRVPLDVEAVVELRQPLRSPVVKFTILDSGGKVLFVAPPRPIEPGLERVSGRFRISARIENHLASGRFALMCRVMEPGAEDDSNESNGGGIRSAGKWLTFNVESPDEPGSILSADTEISVAPDEAAVDAAGVSLQ
jgi:ABC-type polysaccharide/polyol phosphate transport system ATPase subunit